MSSNNSGVEVASQFPVLDTLRVVGALAVLTTHASFQTGEYLDNGVAGFLLARLDVGVAIFFVLSGFLLSRPYLARRALAMPHPSTGVYFEKRALRIFPVYLVTVVIALLFVPANDDVSPWDWVTNLLLLQTYTAKSLPHGLTHMWSLAVEVLFYLVLPLLMSIVLRRGLAARPMALLLGAMVITSLVWHAWISSAIDPHVDGNPNLWLPAYLTWFAAGIGLAFVHVRRQQGLLPRRLERLVDLGRQPGVCWTLVAALMLVAATPLAGPTMLAAPTATQAVTKHLLYAFIGALIVLTGAFVRPGSFNTAMSWRPLRHLGHISYSVFCIHLSLLTAAFALTDRQEFTGGGLWIWTVTLVMTLAASEVLYRVLEMPAMKLQGRLRRRESAAATATAPESTATTR